MTRPSVLFVTPATPAETGNGLAMRAGVWLEGLARRHDVRILVAPVFGHAASPGELVRRCASSFAVLDLQARLSSATAMARLAHAEGRDQARLLQERPLLARRATPAAAQTVADVASGCAAVHVMRAYLAPLLDVLLAAERRPKLTLDVDDLESSLERDSDPAGSDEQSRYRRLEHEYLPCLDAVSVAAADDERLLRQRHPEALVVCVPNAVRIPPRPHGTGTPTRGLLLVGNLSYGPNVEGAEWFVQQVLPLLENPHDGVTLVGSRPAPRVWALNRHPSVQVVADVAAVAPWYAQARVALAPLLRGGGTRIKVIEALAHGRPVVATPVGARGLDPALIGDARTADTPILVGDAPHAFAEGCARLLADGALAGRLGEAGRAGVQATVSIDHVAAKIDRLMRATIAGDVPSL